MTIAMRDFEEVKECALKFNKFFYVGNTEEINQNFATDCADFDPFNPIHQAAYLSLMNAINSPLEDDDIFGTDSVIAEQFAYIIWLSVYDIYKKMAIFLVKNIPEEMLRKHLFIADFGPSKMSKEELTKHIRSMFMNNFNPDRFRKCK